MLSEIRQPGTCMTVNKMRIWNRHLMSVSEKFKEEFELLL